MAGHNETEDSRYERFVLLLTQNDKRIRWFVRSLLSSSDGVDDVSQNTALECWRKFGDFCEKCPSLDSQDFLRWAFVIARFKALSWIRDQARDRLRFQESVVLQIANQAEQDLHHYEARMESIDHCLGLMDEEPRRLLLSVHVPGESVAKIAKETDTKSRRLYSKLNVLRKNMLECITQRLHMEHGFGK